MRHVDSVSPPLSVRVRMVPRSACPDRRQNPVAARSEVSRVLMQRRIQTERQSAVDSGPGHRGTEALAVGRRRPVPTLSERRPSAGLRRMRRYPQVPSARTCVWHEGAICRSHRAARGSDRTPERESQPRPREFRIECLLCRSFTNFSPSTEVRDRCRSRTELRHYRNASLPGRDDLADHRADHLAGDHQLHAPILLPARRGVVGRHRLSLAEALRRDRSSPAIPCCVR